MKSELRIVHKNIEKTIKKGRAAFVSGHPVTVIVDGKDYSFFGFSIITRLTDDEPIALLIDYMKAHSEAHLAYRSALTRMIKQYAKVLRLHPWKVKRRFRLLRLGRVEYGSRWDFANQQQDTYYE